MPLATVAERVDRALLADRGDDVLQKPSLRGMEEDVAERYGPYACLPGKRCEIVQPQRIVGPAAKGEAAIAARAEGRAQLVKMRRGRRTRVAWEQDRNQPLVPRDDVAPAERAATFASTRLAEGQQPGEPREAIETPYLRVANVQRGQLDLGEMKTITVKQSDLNAINSAMATY